MWVPRPQEQDLIFSTKIEGFDNKLIIIGFTCINILSNNHPWTNSTCTQLMIKILSSWMSHMWCTFLSKYCYITDKNNYQLTIRILEMFLGHILWKLLLSILNRIIIHVPTNQLMIIMLSIYLSHMWFKLFLSKYYELPVKEIIIN